MTASQPQTKIQAQAAVVLPAKLAAKSLDLASLYVIRHAVQTGEEVSVDHQDYRISAVCRAVKGIDNFSSTVFRIEAKDRRARAYQDTRSIRELPGSIERATRFPRRQLNQSDNGAFPAGHIDAHHPELHMDPQGRLHTFSQYIDFATTDKEHIIASLSDMIISYERHAAQGAAASIG